MSSKSSSGQSPFVFAHRPELSNLPTAAYEYEVGLHGGFAVDQRPGYGHIYYGMAGAGLLRVDADLGRQEIIALPAELQNINFHSTKIGDFDGQRRLFLPANSEEMVVVLTLDGKIDFTLPRPEFEAYAQEETPYRPTDTVLNGDQLLVADGYGANYISTADLPTRQWKSSFGGKTEDAHVHGSFGTAHGFNLLPGGGLAIADRLHSRFEIYTVDGEYQRTYSLPAGSRPCGINFTEYKGRGYAVVGSLNDPNPDRPAPIYILDAEDFSLLSTIRPKEDLGIELADHLHNVIWYQHAGQLYLICQAWNPGHYFVLELV